MGKQVSAAGEKVLALIAAGSDTEEALEKAARSDPEGMARTLAALTKRGKIVRRWKDGEMRYQITQ